MTTKVLVARLWSSYPWPEWNLPMQKMTPRKLLRYASQPKYVSDETRTLEQPTAAWDYGRIRFFYEQLTTGKRLDPIEIDNRCAGDWIYPEPVLIDGHHRLAASYLAGAKIIRASYSGRIDLLRYLTGARKTCPAE